VASGRQLSGKPVEDFPPRERGRWDFSKVADGRVYELRRGRDFDVAVDSLAVAARRWARRHGYRLTTRSACDEDQRGRPKVALYVRFERQRQREGQGGR